MKNPIADSRYAFVDQLLLDTVATLLLSLPKGFKFRGYIDGVFMFTGRTYEGSFLTTYTPDERRNLRDLIRNGPHPSLHGGAMFTADGLGEDEIKWDPKWGVFTAPNGTFVQSHHGNPSRNKDMHPDLMEYGVVHQGVYKQLIPCSRPARDHVLDDHLDLWTGPARTKGLTVRPGPPRCSAVSLEGRREDDFYDFCIPRGLRHEERANAINRNLALGVFGDYRPSPAYYDPNRWSVDPDSPDTYVFKGTP